MAHLIPLSEKPRAKEKQYRISFPDITGKIGFSFFFLNKEVFIGIALADVEIEKVIRKRKTKVLRSPTKVHFIAT